MLRLVSNCSRHMYCAGKREAGQRGACEHTLRQEKQPTHEGNDILKAVHPDSEFE